MNPARFLLASACAGYLLARAELHVGVLFLASFSLVAALGAVVVHRVRP